MRRKIDISIFDIKAAKYITRDFFFATDKIEKIYVFNDLEYNDIIVDSIQLNGKSYKYLGEVEKTKIKQYTIITSNKDAKNLLRVVKKGIKILKKMKNNNNDEAYKMAFITSEKVGKYKRRCVYNEDVLEFYKSLNNKQS